MIWPVGAGVALMVKEAELPSVTADPPLIVSWGVLGGGSSSIVIVCVLCDPRL